MTGYAASLSEVIAEPVGFLELTNFTDFTELTNFAELSELKEEI